MKKIIGIAIASLMFTNIGFAEMRLIEEKRIKANYRPISEYFNIKTFCIDGYKFVITNVHTHIGPLVQFYEERDGKSLPAKC